MCTLSAGRCRLSFVIDADSANDRVKLPNVRLELKRGIPEQHKRVDTRLSSSDDLSNSDHSQIVVNRLQALHFAQHLLLHVIPRYNLCANPKSSQLPHIQPAFEALVECLYQGDENALATPFNIREKKMRFCQI